MSTPCSLPPIADVANVAASSSPALAIPARLPAAVAGQAFAEVIPKAAVIARPVRWATWAVAIARCTSVAAASSKTSVAAALAQLAAAASAAGIVVAMAGVAAKVVEVGTAVATAIALASGAAADAAPPVRRSPAV